MTKLHELARLGQSIWLDFIRRSLITSGELGRLVDLGVRGMTSNSLSLADSSPAWIRRVSANAVLIALGAE